MFIKSGLVFQNKNKIAEEKETFFFFFKDQDILQQSIGVCSGAHTENTHHYVSSKMVTLENKISLINYFSFNFLFFSSAEIFTSTHT